MIIQYTILFIYEKIKELINYIKYKFSVPSYFRVKKIEKDYSKTETKIENPKTEPSNDISKKYYYKPKRVLNQRKVLSEKKQEQLRNARKKAQETYRRRREQKARLQEEERIKKYVKILKPEIIKEVKEPIKEPEPTEDKEYTIEEILKQMEQEFY